MHAGDEGVETGWHTMHAGLCVGLVREAPSPFPSPPDPVCQPFPPVCPSPLSLLHLPSSYPPPHPDPCVLPPLHSCSSPEQLLCLPPLSPTHQSRVASSTCALVTTSLSRMRAWDSDSRIRDSSWRGVATITFLRRPSWKSDGNTLSVADAAHKLHPSASHTHITCPHKPYPLDVMRKI